MESKQQDIIPIVYDDFEKVSKDRIFITPNRNGLYILHEPKNIIDVSYRDFSQRMFFEIAYPNAMLIFQNNPSTRDFPIDFVDAFTRKQIAKEYKKWDEQQVLQPFLYDLLTNDLSKKEQINVLKYFITNTCFLSGGR